MSTKPFRFGGYEIDRPHWRQVEEAVRLYPIRKEKLELLRARREHRDRPDYNSYRSPELGGIPGAPEQVGNPTLQRVIDMETYREDLAERIYLDQWLSSMDMVLYERLDDLQRRVIEQYAMRPKSRRTLITEAMGEDCTASQSQCYEWLNTALLEFAFLLLNERVIRKIPEKRAEKERKMIGNQNPETVICS